MEPENKNQRSFTEEGLKTVETERAAGVIPHVNMAGEQPSTSKVINIADHLPMGDKLQKANIPVADKADVPVMHQVTDPAIPKEEMPQEEPTAPEFHTTGYVETTPVQHVGAAGEPAATTEAIKTAAEMAAEPGLSDDEKNAKDYEGFCKLPYIELYTRHSTIKGDVEELKSSKKMIDQVGDIFKNGEGEHTADEKTAAIAFSNVMDKQKFGKSAQQFYADYPRLFHDGVRLLSLLEAMLETYPEELRHSTTFVSQSMVESSNLRKEGMLRAERDPNKPDNVPMVLRRLETVTSAYEDRTNFEPLFQKLQFPHNIRKLYKEFISMEPKDAMTEIDETFVKVFNDPHMSKFRAVFMDQVRTEESTETQLEVLTFFLTYWLAKTYNQEFNSGKCSYVKTFVMNFYDIKSHMFDCAGGPPYMITMAQCIFALIAFAATANVPKKALGDKYAELYSMMMATLESAKVSYGETFKARELTTGTSLIEMYPNLSYSVFCEEREMLAGDDDDRTDEAAAEDTPELPVADVAAEDAPTGVSN